MIILNTKDVFLTKDLDGKKRDLSYRVNTIVHADLFAGRALSRALSKDASYSQLNDRSKNNKHQHVYVRMPGNIIDDFLYIYGNKYLDQALVRFGKRKYVDIKKQYKRMNHSSLVDEKKLVFDPKDNQYIIFFNNSRKIIYAMNEVFVEVVPSKRSSDDKSEFWNISKKYRPMTIGKLLTLEKKQTIFLMHRH